MPDLESLEEARGNSFARPPEIGGAVSVTIEKVARMSPEQRRGYLSRIRAGICDSPPSAVVDWLEADEADYEASVAQLPGGMTHREKTAAEHRRRANLTDSEAAARVAASRTWPPPPAPDPPSDDYAPYLWRAS